MIRKHILPTLVSLLFFVWPTLTFAQGFETITYGEIVTAEITPAVSTLTYQFEGSAGDFVYITMGAVEEGDFVPSLRLFTDDQELLQEAETLGDMALVGPMELPYDGMYIISAGKADWSDTFGAFELWVNVVEPHFMSPGEGYEGFLGSRLELGFVVLTAHERDLVSFDLYIEEGGFALFSTTGDLLFIDGGYENPGIALFELPEDGEYLIIVQTLVPEREFYLNVDRIEPIALTRGEPFEGDFYSNDTVFFSFESQAGKAWDVTAEFEFTGYRTMSIYLLQNRMYWEAELRYDDGSGPNGNPRITQFIAPEDGTYFVAVTAYAEEDGEAYPATVSLSPATLLNVVSGIVQNGTVSPETGDVIYYYAGDENESITIDITRLSEAGAIGLRMLSPEDEVAYFVGRSARGASIDVILPIAGSYVFEVWNAAYDNYESTLDFSLLVTSATK